MRCHQEIASQDSRELSPSELVSSFLFFDPQWRQKVFRGGLLLLLPPIGWPAILGYRKELIHSLQHGTTPMLPDWERGVWYYYLEGVKAMGVILGYLSPLFLILFILLAANGEAPSYSWLLPCGFFATFTILSPLAFPTLVLYWMCFSDSYRLPILLGSILLLLFAIVVFFIPAGFLQVSRTGRYRSAFNITAALHTLLSHFRAYCWAWYYSSIMSLIGHFGIPFSPWGVVWCYLAIIYAFNSLLEEECKSESSWYIKLRESPLKLQHLSLSRVLITGKNIREEALKVGPILVPLPSLLQKRVAT